MPRNLLPSAIRDILERGEFHELVGVLEDDQVETKQAPYQIAQEHQKQELAKDLSALANREGGVLLIGPATNRDPSHLGDQIRGISTFDVTLVNIETYHSILGDWVYPRLEDVEIRWFESRTERGRGVVAIFVPPQPETRKPFLITKTIDSSARRTDVLFGYSERRRANAVPFSVQEIHALLRDGRTAGRHERAIDELRRELREGLSSRATGPRVEPTLTRAEVSRRINAAREAVRFLARPCIIHAAYPAQQTTVPTLFDAKGAAVDVLEHPPELRRNGFVLADVRPGSSVIVRGELRRRLYPDYLLLELWRDGVLIGVAPGDENFLLWSSRGGNKVNPLVLGESVFVFVETMKRASEVMEPRPSEIWFEIRLSFLPDAELPKLPPGPLKSMTWETGMGSAVAQASDFDVAVQHGVDVDSGVIAFDLVSRLYNWFGLPTDAVPYTTKVNGRAALNPAQLVEAGR